MFVTLIFDGDWYLPALVYLNAYVKVGKPNIYIYVYLCIYILVSVAAEVTKSVPVSFLFLYSHRYTWFPLTSILIGRLGLRLMPIVADFSDFPTFPYLPLFNFISLALNHLQLQVFTNLIVCDTRGNGSLLTE